MTESLYVVKVRRFYRGVETTSVLFGPRSKSEAEIKERELSALYQSTQYYVEEWKK